MIDRLGCHSDDEPESGLLSFLHDATAGESPTRIVIVFTNGISLTIDLPPRDDD